MQPVEQDLCGEACVERGERIKDKQEPIFYVTEGSHEEVDQSPFPERLLKKECETLYLTKAVDEYTISALPGFERKKSQNVAKDDSSCDKFYDDPSDRRVYYDDFSCRRFC